MRRLVAIIVALIGLAVISYVAVMRVQQWHAEQMHMAVEQERREHEYQVQLLHEELEEKQDEIALLQQDTVSEQRLAEALGEPISLPPADDPEIRHQNAARRLSSFLTYLDGRDYMQPYLEETSARVLLEDALIRLSENPPFVGNEKQDLESLLRNLAHFYRFLKKEPVRMIAAILREEADVLEPVLADAMTWINGDAPVDDLPPPPDKAVLYDYAAYFLETLGGKSYLARRGPKIRILATFYSLQILDMANDHGLNTHGIDIRPHLDVAVDDVRSQQGLVLKKHYIETLEGLKNKYQTPTSGFYPLLKR